MSAIGGKPSGVIFTKRQKDKFYDFPLKPLKYDGGAIIYLIGWHNFR